MIEMNNRRVLITQADLTACSVLVDARYGEPDLETARMQAVRELIGSASALERAIRVQARCALVNHYGTRGTRDLGEATDALFEAMQDYASVIRRIGARFYKDDVNGARVPRLEVV